MSGKIKYHNSWSKLKNTINQQKQKANQKTQTMKQQVIQKVRRHKIHKWVKMFNKYFTEEDIWMANKLKITSHQRDTK